MRDDQSDRIKDFLLRKQADVSLRAKDNRLFVENVLYHYGDGAQTPWRDL